MKTLIFLKSLKRMASVFAVPICMISISLLFLGHAPLYGAPQIPDMTGTWTVAVSSCDFDSLTPSAAFSADDISIRCEESEGPSEFVITDRRVDGNVFAGYYMSDYADNDVTHYRYSHLTGIVMPDGTVGIQILTYYYAESTWESTERVVATGILKVQGGVYIMTGYAHVYQEGAHGNNAPERISTSYFSATKTGPVPE